MRRTPDLRARLLLRAALATVILAAGALGARCASAAENPQVAVGTFPTGITLDAASDTVYVADGDSGSISAIDASSCNARDLRGCRRQASAASGAPDPVGAAVDPATNTLYVADASGRIAVLDASRCEPAERSACSRRPVTIPVGVLPQFLLVDPAAHTLYVANVGSNTISVIDTRTCNARRTADCQAPRASIEAGPGPFELALDQETGSLYVTDLVGDTISIVDARTCNALDTRGCRRPPAVADIGAIPGGIAFDARTDTLYVTEELSARVAVIDAARCNAHTTAGCSPSAYIRAGAGARGIALDEATDTVYVANTIADSVSVIDGASCDAAVRSGCDQHAPAAPVGASPRRLVVDPANGTVYVTNAEAGTVSMIDAVDCDARVHSGCGEAPPTSRTPPPPA